MSKYKLMRPTQIGHLPQEVQHIGAQLGLSRQQKGGQIARRARFLRTVHDQRPRFAVRVDNVRVVDTLV